MDLEVIRELFEIIEDRRDSPKHGSYVSKIMAEGSKKILKKINEEAKELVIAAPGKGKDLSVHEAADLLFHTLVLIAYKRIPLADVLDELRRRRIGR